jgi:hypothetical protein
VWNFRKCVVRHCNAADRKRGPVVGGRPILTESESSPDRPAVTTWAHLNSARKLVSSIGSRPNPPCLRQYSLSPLPLSCLRVSSPMINLRAPRRAAKVSTTTTANASQPTKWEPRP